MVNLNLDTRYVREDGEVTGPLEKSKKDFHLFFDPRHGITYSEFGECTHWDGSYNIQEEFVDVVVSGPTLYALKESIAKWEQNVKAPVRDITLGTNSCALCVRTYDKYDMVRCHMCPVMAKTKDFMCQRTPYKKASTAADFLRIDPGNIHLRNDWEEAAQAEVDFLKSLLPTEGGQL